MSRWSRIPVLIAMCLACGFLLNSPADVQACMADCDICFLLGCSGCSTDGSGGVDCTGCGGGGIEQSRVMTPPTTVTFLGARRAQITVRGYKTTHLQPTTNCVTGLSPVEGVERVNSVTNHNSDTGQRFKEVSFFSSETPSREIADIAGDAGLPLGDQPWFGFQSKITGTVEDNVNNHFVIDVTLKEGVSHTAFLDALRTQGVFVTSSATPDGVPNRGHEYVRRLASTEMVVRFPVRPVTPQRDRP